MIDIHLDLDTVLIWVLVGLVAGSLASRVALGHSLGLIGDLLEIGRASCRERV